MDIVRKWWQKQMKPYASTNNKRSRKTESLRKKIRKDRHEAAMLPDRPGQNRRFLTVDEMAGRAGGGWISWAAPPRYPLRYLGAPVSRAQAADADGRSNPALVRRGIMRRV